MSGGYWAGSGSGTLGLCCDTSSSAGAALPGRLRERAALKSGLSGSRSGAVFVYVRPGRDSPDE